MQYRSAQTWENQVSLLYPRTYVLTTNEMWIV
jgi:hypothetical protein